MAFVANLPVALAPGLGLNAFFSYTVVIGMGCSWQLALTAVLLEGILFIILSICGVREAIIKSIPDGLKKAVAVGIGLFITIIGLSNAGIVVQAAGTPIEFVNFNMQHPTAIVAILGLVITIIPLPQVLTQHDADFISMCQIGSVCMGGNVYVKFYRDYDGKIFKGEPYEKN